LNETFEEGMRFVRLALKFGMVLAADEIRMIPELNQFRECTVRGCSGNDESFFVHPVSIFHVELVTVPVTLHHFGLAVNLFGQRSFHNLCRPRPQPHAGAFAVDFFPLLFEQRNHWVRRVGIELRAVCFLNPANVSREFDRRHLHTEAEPEIRNPMLARVTCCFDFAFDAAVTESTRNQDAGDIFKLRADAVLQRFGIDQFQIDPAILTRSRVGKRFVNAFVSVL